MSDPPDWPSVRRLLVVRLDNVGDVVLLSSTLRALKEFVPRATITLLASPAGASVVPMLPWVDQVLVRRTLWQDASESLPFDPAREQALIENLGEGGFDAALIFTSFSQTAFPAAYACYLAGIPLRIGHAREFGGGVLSHPVPAPDIELHQAERDLHLIEAVGVGVVDRSSALVLRPEVRAEADALLESVGVQQSDPFVALVPGASAAARRYHPDGFGVAASAIEGAGAPVVALGTEAERPLVAAARATGRRVRSLVGKTTLETAAAVIARASAVIANNSAALHIADAFSRPLVVTYSGTDLVSQWRPRNAPAVMLSRPTTCAPCYGFTCARVGADHMGCLDIPPLEVARAALTLLDNGVEERGPKCAS